MKTLQITNPDINNYCEEHSQAEDKLLYELYRETHLTIINPVMLSGHLQGQTLKMLSNMIQPNNVLEVGTYTGYSAICLASSLQKNGTLDTIEFDPELEFIANKYFTKANLSKQITQHIGDAVQIIPTLNKTYDLVFIDADKENYLNYYTLIINKVKKGGYIIIDNVLWHGKVVIETEQGKDTQVIRELNLLIQKDERVENVLLPIRDGLMICRKIC